jgi:3-oxoacyl-[acyl-carrier-protein] synthase II
MRAYINGIGSITPQQTSDTKNFLGEIKTYESQALRCIEPEYKDFISPTLIRRMGRIIKMGVAAAQLCLKDAKIEMPDAILTGTGLGCVEDTEKFLTAIIENKEQFLTPTSFIQSTHNTVGGQIALLLKCNNYNFTYVHRGFSFETCVLDALLLLNENDSKNILIGGVDELTPNTFILMQRLGLVKNKPILNTDLLKHQTRGSIAGEGANFFSLSKKLTPDSYAALIGCKLIYKPISITAVEVEISKLLAQNNLTEQDIDLVICGLNGDAKQDKIYKQVLENKFEKSSSAYYKHLSGEYFTANSVGFLLACQILKSKAIPPSVLLSNKEREPKYILLYNHHSGINHSLLLFQAC